MTQPTIVDLDADPFEGAEKAATPEFQQAIGLLFVVSGAAEATLALEVLRMMSHPNKLTLTATPLVCGMELKVKLGMIRTYAAMHGLDAKEISALTDDIRTAFGRRNEFAHSVVKPQTDPKSVLVQSLKFDARGQIPNPQRHTAFQIRGYARAIHSSVRALHDRLTQIGYRKSTELL